MFRKCFAQNNKNLYNIINQTHIHANILLPKLRVASSSLVYRSQNKGLNDSTLAKFSPFLLPDSHTGNNIMNGGCVAHLHNTASADMGC